VAKGKSKEVATKHAPFGTIEDSFGSNPGTIEVTGGTMHTFGHKPHRGQVWPTNVVSPDVKTGYPKGFDQKMKGPKP
jgi:hypothetical protein